MLTPTLFYCLWTMCCREAVGSSKSRLYKTTDEAIEALFAISSDVEDSADDLDDCNDTGNTEIVTHAVQSSNSVADGDTDDSDDDDVLYRLASDMSEEYTDNSTVSSDVDDDFDVNSADDETEWSKTEVDPVALDFDAVWVVPTFPFLPTDGPLEFFSRYIDADVLELLVQQTNMYAEQCKLRNWEDVSAEELKSFLGILIATGLHSVPDIELFWNTDQLFRVQPIADIMPLKRFKKILQGLHMNDNSRAPKCGETDFDKLYKVRPLIQMMNARFKDQCVSSSSQSIDEAMVLFKGRSSLKQYMPLKPVKRGYKIWLRCDSETGYVYQFDIYAGKSDDGQVSTGLDSRVVMSLVDGIENTGCHVAFDNLFSSVELMEELFSRGIYATATVRTNRKRLPVFVKHTSKMAKADFKWRTLQNTPYVQWMDTKLVHFLSTAFSPTRLCKVQRKQKNGEKSTLTCSESVAEYTRRMGGVDRLDQKRGSYSISRRSRRWWLQLFYFFIDCAITNAHVLHSSVHHRTV